MQFLACVIFYLKVRIVLCFLPATDCMIRANFSDDELFPDLRLLLLRKVDRKIGLSARNAGTLAGERHWLVTV
jgi:hypothetical protein